MKSKILNFKIKTIKQEEIINSYEYPYDNGRTCFEPYILQTTYYGIDVVNNQKCIFTHNLNFSKSVGLINGNHYDKDETDFLKITEKKLETHKSTSPEIFPDAIAFEKHNEVTIKHCVDDTIEIVGLPKSKDPEKSLLLRYTRVKLYK